MKKISKLLLAISFVLSIISSAYAVTVVSWGGAYTNSQKLLMIEQPSEILPVTNISRWSSMPR